MKKQLKLLIIIAISIMFIMPSNIEAKTSNRNIGLNEVSKYVQIEANTTNQTNNVATINNNFNKSQNCNSLLGNPSDSKTGAWLLVKLLNYLRVIGPLAVIVLSGIEFTKTIVTSDDENMKKAQNHLITRLVLVAVLFLVPTFTKLLLQVFNIVSDPMCGIK